MPRLVKPAVLISVGRLVVRPQAVTDLDDIFDYIAEHSLDRAIAFVRKLYGQMEKLATSPGIGRRRDALLSGLRSFPCGNYLIFYMPADDGADGVRVLNGARDIEALFQDDRL
jgi:toxin ParE1/3/4